MANRASEVVRSLVERLSTTTDRAIHAFHRSPPESEEFLRRLLRNLPGMAYRCLNDRQWTMEFVSRGCRDLTGFDAQDLVGNGVVSYTSLIHPDDRDRVWNTVQHAVADGGSFRLTYRIRRADGRQRLVWERGCAVVGRDGKVEALEGFVTDVTEEVALADRVLDQESQYRALVEQSLAGVYIVGDRELLYANQRYAEIFGYTLEELKEIGSFLDLVHPDDRDMVAGKVRSRLAGEAVDARYEVRIVRKDGTVREIEAHGRPIEHHGSPAVMGILIDITERKREQRRYHEAQKLEALGRLASGVAHDLNNFLTLIKVTAQLAMADRRDDAELMDDLAEIVASVDRGAALSGQLLTFGRPRPESESAASVPTIIEGLRPMLIRALGKDIELISAVGPALPDVTVGPAQLEEIVMNLVVNARDAMPDGGVLTVSARSAGPSAGARGIHARPHVVMAVSDTGVGIDPAAHRLLFEPYFTTKGDRGTGLGLSNVWRIVTDVGGSVELESELGGGSTFRIYLPTHT